MKKYLKLRTAIMAADKKQDELAAAIAVSPSTFSKKMNALTAWTVWEAYTVCELLHIPDHDLPEYFPRELSVPYDGVATQLAMRNGGNGGKTKCKN